MDKHEFRFDTYSVDESMTDEGKLRDAANKLTDDLIAFIAKEIGESAPSRRELFTNREQLLLYLGHYDRLVTEGRIILPDEDALMPCGDTPDKVIGVYKKRTQMGLDGILLTVSGADDLAPEVLEAMSTLPKDRLEMILKVGDPANYEVPVILALGALSDVQFNTIVTSYGRPGLRDTRLSGAKVDVLKAVAKLKDEVMAQLYFAWYVELENSKSAAVLEEIAKIDLPIDLLPLIDFGCAQPEEVAHIGKGMNQMKWAKVREARERKVPAGQEDPFRMNHWLIMEIAKLSDEQFEALGEIDWIFIGGYQRAYGGVFRDISKTQFPAKRIKAIGGNRLNVMCDLTQPIEEYKNTSLVEELGRLTDEEVESYGGLNKILDISLGKPLEVKERAALVAEINELINIHPVNMDKGRQFTGSEDYFPHAHLLALKEAIYNARDSRIGDSAPLLNCLENAFRQNDTGNNYHLFANKNDFCSPLHLRLAAFCKQIFPEARSIAGILKYNRSQDGDETKIPLVSHQDRTIMDPNSPKHPVPRYGFLIRKPVCERIDSIFGTNTVGDDLARYLSYWPLHRDDLLSHFTEEDMRFIARNRGFRSFLDHKDITDKTILQILNSNVNGFSAWLSNLVVTCSMTEQRYQILVNGDVDYFVAMYQEEIKQAKLASRPKVTITI